MLNPLDAMLSGSRSVYLAFHKKPKKPISVDLRGQPASDLIEQNIRSGNPLMVARFGNVELDCMIATANANKPGYGKYLDYIKGKTKACNLRAKQIRRANINAGIFPPTRETIFQFGRLMRSDIRELDVLGSWLEYEHVVLVDRSAIKTVFLTDIEPYTHANPWSKSLAGKNVLVVHPFARSIESQYKKRSQLFDNPDVLPDFKLTTIKSVQSAAGAVNLPHKDWFAALDSMKEKINATDFDIAIIGCGAYGFPLAAHVKRLGKQAIHMGGATQILFGIKGKRWDSFPNIASLYNEHWVSPSAEETPDKSHLVEGGCYW